MSVTSGHAIGNVDTASYHVSRSLLLGKHMETWIRSDLLPPHGEDALVWKTPLIKPCRRYGIRSTKLWTGKENQSTRIEAVRSWIGLLRYGRFWKWRVRLSRASWYCFRYLFGIRSSNHCGGLWRWSCSLLSNSWITCGAQCAGNQIIRESAGQKPPIQSDFFVDLCCARHYNCGSHWAVLVLSLLDNEIKKKGQGPKTTRQQNRNKAPNQHPKTKQTTRPWPIEQKVKPGETSSGSHRKLQSPALTTSSAGNSQRPMQCVVTQ